MGQLSNGVRLWQRPAPEGPPESGVPQQPIRGLGRIFHVLGMPGLAIGNSYFIYFNFIFQHPLQSGYLPRIGILSLCLGAEPCGAVGPGHCACNAKGNAKWLTNSNRAWDDEDIVEKRHQNARSFWDVWENAKDAWEMCSSAWFLIW